MLTPAVLIEDQNLLGNSFAGPSWSRWRAVLKAAFAEPLTDADAVLFREVAERDPPAERVRELWAIVGRRGGKDSIAAAIATAAAVGDYNAHLRPGERAAVVCLASDRIQARIVFRYIRANFTETPLLAPLIVRESEETLELTNGVEIVVVTNSFRAIRGRTVVCAILDEVAYWRDEASATPDAETYAALLPSMATIPNAILVGISSPYRRAGLLFDRYRRHYGQPGDILVVRGASKLFNPTLPDRIIEQAIERDPEAAAAEYGAEWRSDIASFVSREAVEGCTAPGRLELPPIPGTRYAAFVDPSGGSADSMTLAVSHTEGNIRVLDCVREVRPPFSPEAVVQDFAAVLKSYRLVAVTGDRYAGEWPRERFREHGIRYEISERAKNEIYRDSLPLLNAKQLELLDLPRLATQLVGLERRTARGGRDSIDHAPGGHDDVANAVLGALLLSGGRRVMNVSAAALRDV